MDSESQIQNTTSSFAVSNYSTTIVSLSTSFSTIFLVIVYVGYPFAHYQTGILLLSPQYVLNKIKNACDYEGLLAAKCGQVRRTERDHETNTLVSPFRAFLVYNTTDTGGGTSENFRTPAKDSPTNNTLKSRK